MYVSHEEQVLRARRTWNAKNPAKARRIALFWRIYWFGSPIALGAAIVWMALNFKPVDTIVVAIIGVAALWFIGAIMASIFSSIRNEPSDPASNSAYFS